MNIKELIKKIEGKSYLPNMQLLLTHIKDQEETIEGYVLHLEQVCEDLYNLKAENKRLRESEGLIEFVGCMLDEIEANKEKKGDWKEWPIVPEKVSHEFIWHQGKLFDALVSKDQEGILEYCADIANLAYFVAVNTDALSKDKT